LPQWFSIHFERRVCNPIAVVPERLPTVPGSSPVDRHSGASPLPLKHLECGPSCKGGDIKRDCPRDSVPRKTRLNGFHRGVCADPQAAIIIIIIIIIIIRKVVPVHYAMKTYTGVEV
jgi:hypothetical protein